MNEASEKIVGALRAVGVEVESVYDLVNSKKPYPAAIEVLIGHLELGITDEGNLREGVIRALTVKEAIGIASPALLSEFNRTTNPIVNWAIGNALGLTMTQRELGGVLKIVANREYGSARQMLVLALGKFAHEAGVEKILIELLTDQDVVLHAIGALRRIRSSRAVPALRELAASPRREVAREASKLILEIGNRR